MTTAPKQLPDAEQMALEPRGCPTPGACSVVYILAEKNAEIARLRAALLRLADAADRVGILYFDTDDLRKVVIEMQASTQAARELLK